jgi:hypothetical protein
VYILKFPICNHICEGSLEVQLPTNVDRWKSRGGKRQGGEEQKREDKRRESLRRKKM